MNLKRPFNSEDMYEVAYKHPRQWDHTNHLAPVDLAPSKHASLKHQTSDGEVGISFDKCKDERILANDTGADFQDNTNKELGPGTSSCKSHFWWASSNAIERDTKSEAAIHLSLFPEFFVSGHQLRALFQSDEFCSSIFDSSPRKLVSVGPEYQAEVPECGRPGFKSYSVQQDLPDSKASDSDLIADDKNEEKLIGTCVLSMPDFESSANYCEDMGTRSDCKCLDQGSVRCVRQHVSEARARLRGSLGQEAFEGLGFCEMGEEVVKKWAEKEEQTFNKIVQSNPASLGKNFWDHLAVIFPSRSKKDLVSYYFNVFMLRKRADQNRIRTLHIDSDNDEWEGIVDGTAEEDEDSVVESPGNQGALAYYLENSVDDCHEDIEEDEVYGCRDMVNLVCGVATDEEDVGDVDDISGEQFENYVNKSDGDTNSPHVGKSQSNNGDGYDIQDDSCTSYECQHDKIDGCGTPDMGTGLKQSSEE